MPMRLSHKPQEASGAELLAVSLHAVSLHHDTLLDAMIAGCAITIHADGEAISAERDRALLLVHSSPLLRAYSPDAVLRAFKTHVQ